MRLIWARLTYTLAPSPTPATINTYCQCGEEMEGVQTTTNTGGTTFIGCGTTTLSTITPTLNPTPTQSVQCYPTHGGNPITSEDELVQILFQGVNVGDTTTCNGTNANWKIPSNADSSSPAGNNNVIQGYTINSNAPDDCQHFYKGNLTPLQVDLCSLPLVAIIKACPYNGGTIDTVCGTSWITTCVDGGACVAHSPGGN
jgi:hypothetical protein